MSKIKQFIKNISPLNNRTDMPVMLYVVKVVLIFWFIKLAAELAGEGVVMGVLFATGRNPLNGEMFDPDTMTLVMYYGYILLIGVMLLYWKLFQKKTLSQLGFTKKAGTYLVGVSAGIVLTAVSVSAVMLTGSLTYNGVFEKINTTYIILMLGGFICQGAMEEILCRGIALNLLKERLPVPFAVMISTALFVIPHLSNMSEAEGAIAVFAVIDLILISLIFSYVTLRFKNLWVACGLHSIWNFILFNILGLNLSGNDTLTSAVFDIRSAGSNIMNGGVYGIEASAVTAAVLAVSLGVCFVLSRKRKEVPALKALAE